MMEPREELIASLGVRNEEGARLLIVIRRWFPNTFLEKNPGWIGPPWRLQEDTV